MSNKRVYDDPYANGPPPELYSAAPPGQQYGGYNSYNTPTPTETGSYLPDKEMTPSERAGADADGVHALGEIGGGEREVPGRTNLHQPTSSFAAMGPPPRSTGILRMWRKDERGKQWFRGGGFRSGFRLFFCCLIIAILIIISIILTVVMFVRPPAVAINNFNIDANSLKLTQGMFNVTVDVDIAVSNPNWFNANFREIAATVSYAGVDIPFGSGKVDNINFKGYTKSKFQFPFTLNYTAENDPNQALIKDLASKCGTGSGGGQISVVAKIFLWLRILGVSVKPTININPTLDCPISGDQISSILGGQLPLN